MSKTHDLQRKIKDIAAEAKGKVAVACSLPGTVLNCDLNPEAMPPMQSAFKLPLALTTQHQVEKGSITLNQPVRFQEDDRILPETHSPLQEKFPNANVDVSVGELLKLTVSDSDNVAAEILLRVAGGPAAVDENIASLGITGFHLQDSEHGLHADVTAYDTAASSVRLRDEGIASSLTVEDFARQILTDSDATGFIHVRDASSGEVLAHVTRHASAIQEQDLAIDFPIRPLSVIKVYLAAEWLEHGFGGTAVDCAASSFRPRRRMFVDDMLVSGCDTAAEKMAVILRRRLGPRRVLEDLRRYGLQDTTLKPDASDYEWGRVLSLGEEEVPVTPRQLSAFLRTIGQGGAALFSQPTAKRLRTALENVVQDGTANSIKGALAMTGWRIGGKTGTGPGQCGDHCDGWFASLLSDQNRARYVILVFIRGRGLGGGLSARTAARVAEYLRSSRSVVTAPAPE